MRVDEVRSASTRAERVCNRSSVSAVFTLSTKDGVTRRMTLSPESCEVLTDVWPGELAEVASNGSPDVGGADCSPLRSIPPVPVVFDVTLTCPVLP